MSGEKRERERERVSQNSERVSCVCEFVRSTIDREKENF